MKVHMRHSLTGSGAVVYADVVPLWTVSLLDPLQYCRNQRPQCLQFVSAQVSHSRCMPPARDENVTGAHRVRIYKSYRVFSRGNDWSAILDSPTEGAGPWKGVRLAHR